MASHHSCCDRQKVNRGLWSPEEDQKLINYVSTYGHGCWSTVPRLAGLQRCGKSCRLRWINYLRPDVKRGNFTPQEAALIIELHRILGNRWSQIAKYLPGRTDNEVKNFWNSSIKKKLLAHARYCRPSDLYFASKLHLNPSNPGESCVVSPQPTKMNNNLFNRTTIPMFNSMDAAAVNQTLKLPQFPPSSPLPVSPDSSFCDVGSWASPYNSQILEDGKNQENPIYDIDKEILEALLPELNGDKSIWNTSGGEDSNQNGGMFPDYDCGTDSCCDAVHPYHIDNITALMASFAQPDSAALLAAFPPSSDSQL